MRNARHLVDYLSSSTTPTLESFELAHLNASSNTMKKLLEFVAQYCEEEAQACLARLMLEFRSAPAPHSVPWASANSVRPENELAQVPPQRKLNGSDSAAPLAAPSNTGRRLRTASDLLLFPHSNAFDETLRRTSLLPRAVARSRAVKAVDSPDSRAASCPSWHSRSNPGRKVPALAPCPGDESNRQSSCANNARSRSSSPRRKNPKDQPDLFEASGQPPRPFASS